MNFHKAVHFCIVLTRILDTVLVFADLTKALADPIQFVCTLNKQSVQATSAADDQVVTEEKAQIPECVDGAVDTSESFTPNIPTCLGNDESSKDVAELEPLTIDELKTHKAFVKMQRKQEKELKELERKCQKKKDDMIQKYSSSFLELCKKNFNLNKGHKKKWSLGNIHEGALCGESLIPTDSMTSNGASAERVSELRDKLQADLQRVYSEQYKLFKDRKEQHITEQVAKLMEIAKEKQAVEMKSLKESAESEMKEVKKKIELKRQEKIETMLKTTTDKSLQEKRKKEINEHHIQMSVKLFKLALANQSNAEGKLQEQHSVKLEEIKEKEKEYQREAQNEYEAKMSALPQVVVELSNSITTTKFTLESERAQNQGKDVVESKANELPPTNGMMENPPCSESKEDEGGLETLIAEL
ncbi:1-phosphatidylinositol 4,5-bisphosphate phosphodiesterase beta-2-like [Mustelus asterias]